VQVWGGGGTNRLRRRFGGAPDATTGDTPAAGGGGIGSSVAIAELPPIRRDRYPADPAVEKSDRKRRSKRIARDEVRVRARVYIGARAAVARFTWIAPAGAAHLSDSDRRYRRCSSLPRRRSPPAKLMAPSRSLRGCNSVV